MRRTISKYNSLRLDNLIFYWVSFASWVLCFCFVSEQSVRDILLTMRKRNNVFCSTHRSRTMLQSGGDPSVSAAIRNTMRSKKKKCFGLRVLVESPLLRPMPTCVTFLVPPLCMSVITTDVDVYETHHTP